MPIFENETEKIVKTLGLEWEPVAVKFSDSADEKGIPRKLKVCQAIDVVRRESVTINLSKENCVCPGGRRYTGLEVLPLEAIAGVWTKAHKAYESMDIALSSLKKQPQPVKRGDFLILSPLKKVETDPDMVLLFANAEQADRILGLVSFKEAEPFAYYPVSNTCSVITNTLGKGGPEICFMTKHSRQEFRLSPNELIIGLPFGDFEAAVNNISNSGFGTAQTSPPPKAR